MKKEEFIKNLKEKLSILETKEIDDIIAEYTEYIDEKMQNGKTEEEAIKDFGDIDELTTELLKAYKINVDNNRKEKNVWNSLVTKFNNFMDKIIVLFEQKSGKDILRIIFEVAIIILGICLCKIPFHILEQIGYNVFIPFHSAFGKGLYHIWSFIIECAYLIFALVLFAKIFEQRYLNNINIAMNGSPKEKTENVKKSKKQEPIIVETQTRKSMIDYLATLCIWFVKFIVFWVVFGLALYILGLGMCLGICIYLWIRGVTYIGIYLSILMLLILGVLAFIWLFNWILDRKNNVKFLLIGFTTSFIVLGISFSYASIEVATTEFINTVPSNYEVKEKIETLTITNNEILSGIYDYEVDESLTNEIKIKYTYYSNYVEIEPLIEYEPQNHIYISVNYKNNNWNGKILENVINDLKERKMHNYDLSPKITIYANSETIIKLKANREKWQEEKKYKNLYNYCKMQYNDGEELSNRCQELLFPKHTEMDE